MYAGRRSAVRFGSLFMPADSWEVELGVENVPITTIQILRDAGINGTILAVKPDWSNHGIPTKKISGGMREVTGKLHGFWNVQAGVPSIGDTVSIVFSLDGITFFLINDCLITSMTLSSEVAGAVEWDMEFEAISDTDFTGRF